MNNKTLFGLEYLPSSDVNWEASSSNLASQLESAAYSAQFQTLVTAGCCTDGKVAWYNAFNS